MRVLKSFALLLAASVLPGSATPALAAPVPAEKKPDVEVVFCLDTTGSMSGLISAAKAKIWSISNQIANGKPIPRLKIGLVGYRDRTDTFVTQVFGLTEDLDAVHANLKKFSAGGGGDGPESVNQALHEAVTKIKWSKDKKTLKMVFLVGDAPPHMDYPDDVKYPETCKLAVKEGIIINTVLCGTWAEAGKIWKDVAAKAEGSFVAIPQDGGAVVVIDTPFDKRLAEINEEVCKTVMCWGTEKKQIADLRKNEAARRLRATDAAERIAYQAKNSQAATFDLIDTLAQGKLKLEDIKKEELPKELQGKTLKEQKAHLAKVETRRKELREEAVKLDRERADFIAKKQAEMAKGGKASFDKEVLDILRTQAKKFDIGY